MGDRPGMPQDRNFKAVSELVVDCVHASALGTIAAPFSCGVKGIFQHVAKNHEELGLPGGCLLYTCYPKLTPKSIIADIHDKYSHDLGVRLRCIGERIVI